MASVDRFLLAAVMGYPIFQSRSPVLHNFWFAQHKLAGSYVPLAITPERLEAALRALPALNFSGCNLTIPLKQNALRIVDEVDITARTIGACGPGFLGQLGPEGRVHHQGAGRPELSLGRLEANDDVRVAHDLPLAGRGRPNGRGDD